MKEQTNHASLPAIPRIVREKLNAFRKAQWEYGRRCGRSQENDDEQDASHSFRALEQSIEDALAARPKCDRYEIALWQWCGAGEHWGHDYGGAVSDKKYAEKQAARRNGKVQPLYAPAASVETRPAGEQEPEPVAADHPAEANAPTPSGESDGDWRDDPSADERWNAGCDFATEQLCKVLGIKTDQVNWDAATETLDGDVQSVIWGILRMKLGDDWDADESTLARASLAKPVQVSEAAVDRLFEAVDLQPTGDADYDNARRSSAKAWLREAALPHLPSSNAKAIEVANAEITSAQNYLRCHGVSGGPISSHAAGRLEAASRILAALRNEEPRS